MKAILIILFALVLGLTAYADDMKNEDQLIDQHLSNCDDFWAAWRGAEVTATQVINESEAYVARHLELFREILKQNGLEGRKDLIASKGKVFDHWRRQRAVFLRHLDVNGVAAYRYDGGKNQPFGYILFKAGKPFRLLSLGVHRPDPNLGGVDLPFPVPVHRH